MSRMRFFQPSLFITASSLPEAEVRVPALNIRSSKFSTGVMSDSASLRRIAANCSISRSFVKDAGTISSGRRSLRNGTAIKAARFSKFSAAFTSATNSGKALPSSSTIA